MIQLPPVFDLSLFVSDLFSFALPFVSIAVLFVAYRLIIRALKG